MVRSRPSRWLFAVAVVVFVVGVGFAAWSMIRSMTGNMETMERVIVPGSAEITLSQPGTYTIFYESKSIVDGRLFMGSSDVPGLVITVERQTAKVPLRRASTNTHYSIGGYDGTSVWDFTAESAGTYTLRAAYGSASPGSEVVLAVGQFSVLAAILRGFAMIGLSLLTAGVIVVIALRQERDAYRR